MTRCDADALLDLLADSGTRLTAREFIRRISRIRDIPVSLARNLLTELVSQGHAGYEEIYGTTCIIRNFNRSVRITDHICVTPPGITSLADPGDLDIRLIPGIAFGYGHHPTTRLCLEALDHLFFSHEPRCEALDARAADIGTGSGILAIALILGGIGTCQAFDTDANARQEARRNADLNDLSHQVQILSHPFPGGNADFAIICANLRTPTLDTLSRTLSDRLTPEGALVLSGIRTWEAPDLIQTFQRLGLSVSWHKTAQDWTGLILTRS